MRPSGVDDEELHAICLSEEPVLGHACPATTARRAITPILPQGHEEPRDPCRLPQHETDNSFKDHERDTVFECLSRAGARGARPPTSMRRP